MNKINIFMMIMAIGILCVSCSNIDAKDSSGISKTEKTHSHKHVENEKHSDSQDHNIKNDKDKQSPRLWCKEHNVYEDECTICHPEIKNSSNEEHDHGLFCEEHQVPEAVCGICQPQLLSSLSVGEGLKVRLKTKSISDIMGIFSKKPSESIDLENGNSLGKILYDKNTLAHVTTLSQGTVNRIFVTLGDHVQKGEDLMEILSPGISEIKKEYLSALANENLKKTIYKREKSLIKKKISSIQEFQKAETEYEIAKNMLKATYNQLLSYGFSEKNISSIKKTGIYTPSLILRAPISGEIVKRNSTIGKTTEPGEELFMIADLSTLWLELLVPEMQISRYQLKEKVEVMVDSIPGKSFKGEIFWISSEIEEKSRLIKVIAEIRNDGHLLKNNMYGTVFKQNKKNGVGWLVSGDSIQLIDNREYVFVKKEGDLFEAKYVIVGNRMNNMAQILRGIDENDQIVYEGGFFLKSELLKSKFGAGCVDD